MIEKKSVMVVIRSMLRKLRLSWNPDCIIIIKNREVAIAGQKSGFLLWEGPLAEIDC
jgi:hypothetical protein